MKATFVCWRCEDKEKRLSFNELIERHEDKGHWDYVCPKCESVIICSERRIK